MWRLRLSSPQKRWVTICSHYSKGRVLTWCRLTAAGACCSDQHQACCSLFSAHELGACGASLLVFRCGWALLADLLLGFNGVRLLLTLRHRFAVPNVLPCRSMHLWMCTHLE
jgi:hypothetical protein